uniref:Programmed cell death 2 n=1 Tax=Microcebus murinus TaxID=30608 RepID=A0A8C5Y4W6_MICMU
MAALASRVELGFAEEAPPWRLRSDQFPSKVYAPLPGRADAFHRGLFLFCCREPPCCAGLRVFRNQLPRKNDFYSYEPPSENPPPETGESVCLKLKSGALLCRVCGCLGPKTCSQCHKAHYCGKVHQALDWRSGHKQSSSDRLSYETLSQKKKRKNCCCMEYNTSEIENYQTIFTSKLLLMMLITFFVLDHLDHAIPDHNFLFPEFEIVIETEDEIKPEVVEKEDATEIVGSMSEALEEELDSMAKHESKEDKIFQKFKTQIALEPEQILRYGRGLAPIWISGENIPQEKDIPACPCGAKRIFEFQVMPQLLNYLKADRLGTSVDWGILAVFTCAESCSLGTSYTEEFVWKQDVADTP